VSVDVESLFSEIQRLVDSGDHGAAAAACKDVVDRMADIDEPHLQERVAYALLVKGLSLSRLGQRSEAISVYDELLARYQTTSDRKLLRHVAWARYNRAWTLSALGQRDQSLAAYDEMISSLRDAREPQIRLRVSWALWNKARLLSEASRAADADIAYEELLERHDVGLDGQLDRNIAWTLKRDAWMLGQAGRLEQQLDRCNELIEHFGDTYDEGLLRELLGGMRQRAGALAKLGRATQALEAYEQIARRFSGATQAELRDDVAASFVDKAALLIDLDRIGDAVSACDDALARLADVTEPQLLDRVVKTLLSKGDILRVSQRREEAIVVYESAVAAYRAATSKGAGVELLWAPVLAIFHKVDLLCALDRADEANEVRTQLRSILGGSVAASLRDDELEPGPVAERELAEAFAQLVTVGDCWRWFDASDQRIPTAEMAKRAIELYRLSEPWALADEGSSGLAAQAAAGMLRDIADGYAMLARPLSRKKRDALPLPQRRDDERTALIRRYGIDEWAAELGWRLDLPEVRGGTEHEEYRAERPSGSSADLTDSPNEFVRFFLASAFGYELLTMLCDSHSGREALRNDYFTDYGSYRIAEARRWVRRLTSQVPDAAGAAIAALLMAQTLFRASQLTESPDDMLVPSMSALRDLLREDDTYNWLLREDVELPAWLADDL
jgi:tetratricopeptide (TPR) repeat protein